MKMGTLLRRRRRFNIFDRPYVLWTLRNGSQVLADRGYNPIAERSRSVSTIGHVIDRWQWVEDIAEERWLLTPRFTVDNRRELKQWSNDILWRFLDGWDMRLVLQAYPIKLHNPDGTVSLFKSRDEIKHLGVSKRDRSAPPDWPPPWPAGLRLRSGPELPVLQARIIPLGTLPTPPDATLL
jgi:hypothetical protein